MYVGTSQGVYSQSDGEEWKAVEIAMNSHQLLTRGALLTWCATDVPSPKQHSNMGNDRSRTWLPKPVPERD